MCKGSVLCDDRCTKRNAKREFDPRRRERNLCIEMRCFAVILNMSLLGRFDENVFAILLSVSSPPSSFSLCFSFLYARGKGGDRARTGSISFATAFVVWICKAIVATDKFLLMRYWPCTLSWHNRITNWNDGTDLTPPPFYVVIEFELSRCIYYLWPGVYLCNCVVEMV